MSEAVTFSPEQKRPVLHKLINALPAEGRFVRNKFRAPVQERTRRPLRLSDRGDGFEVVEGRCLDHEPPPVAARRTKTLPDRPAGTMALI